MEPGFGTEWSISYKRIAITCLPAALFFAVFSKKVIVFLYQHSPVDSLAILYCRGGAAHLGRSLCSPVAGHAHSPAHEAGLFRFRLPAAPGCYIQ